MKKGVLTSSPFYILSMAYHAILSEKINCLFYGFCLPLPFGLKSQKGLLFDFLIFSKVSGPTSYQPKYGHSSTAELRSPKPSIVVRIHVPVQCFKY